MRKFFVFFVCIFVSATYTQVCGRIFFKDRKIIPTEAGRISAKLFGGGEIAAAIAVAPYVPRLYRAIKGGYAKKSELQKEKESEDPDDSEDDNDGEELDPLWHSDFQNKIGIRRQDWDADTGSDPFLRYTHPKPTTEPTNEQKLEKSEDKDAKSEESDLDDDDTSSQQSSSSSDEELLHGGGSESGDDEYEYGYGYEYGYDEDLY